MLINIILIATVENWFVNLYLENLNAAVGIYINPLDTELNPICQ